MSAGLVAISEYIPMYEAQYVRIDMSDFLIDYYLHRKEVAPDTKPEHDEKLKDLMACFAIHLASRTARETHAWTVHMVDQEPYSLFVTGDSGEPTVEGVVSGSIIGHVLTENIRHTDVGSIHAHCTARGTTTKSVVQCDSSEIATMVEEFYDKSEQRPLRILLSKTDDTAQGVAALPEYNDQWIRSVDIDSMVKDSNVLRKLLRTSHYSFFCGCSPEKLLPFFRSLPKEALEELYGADNSLKINCPRCGRTFLISRDDLLTH